MTGTVWWTTAELRERLLEFEAAENLIYPVDIEGFLEYLEEKERWRSESTSAKSTESSRSGSP